MSEDQGELFGNNGGRYRDLSKPFESIDAANQAIKAFQDELMALRIKHRIPDLTFCSMLNIADPKAEGGEYQVMIASHYGAAMNFEPMAAFALGRAEADRLAVVGRARQQPKKRSGQ